MPTVPAQPDPQLEPHAQRDTAESFGTDAERYDRARPRYPEELIQAIMAAAPGPDVLDVGCGTGIEARQLRAAGARVLGVEADARMAQFARRDGLSVEVGRFEEWDPAGRTFDAVVAGTAWHWVDPATGARQAARVLRPGGLLAPFWCLLQPPTEVAQALGEALRRFVPDAPFDLGAIARLVDGYQVLLAKVADGIRTVDVFDEPVQWRFETEQTYSRDAWLDNAATSGALTRLDPQVRQQVLDAAGEAIDGDVTVSATTIAVTARRRA